MDEDYGDVLMDSDIDGKPMSEDEGEMDGEPMEEDKPDQPTSKDPSAVAVSSPLQQGNEEPPSKELSETADKTARPPRRRMRAVDMFADDGSEGDG